MPVSRPRPVNRTPRGGIPPQPLWMTVVVSLVVAGGLMLAWNLASGDRPSESALPTRAADAAPVPESVTTVLAQSGTVEVPEVTGMSRAEAEVLLSAAGLTVGVTSDEASASEVPSPDAPIRAQEPKAGALVSGATQVMLSLSASEPTSKVASAAKQPARRRMVVCIDPGHQAKGDSSPEPIGPGSKTTKARVTGGATGAKTGIPEYEIALQISMNLKQRLEERGIRVVMTRTTSDVNLSSAERAAIANDADADLFVRIHCEGSPDAESAGLSTVHPRSNKWTARIAPPSKRAALLIQQSTIARTGAVDRGIAGRDDFAGFNWAKVPAVLIECGFLSNPVEDRLLASPHYQDKLSAGIAEGIAAYLREVK